MVVINNITEIIFNANESGDSDNFKLVFYKNSYRNEIRIKKSLFNTKIFQRQSTSNTLNIFNIKLDKSFISITHPDNEHYFITDILFQKKQTQTDNNNIIFNIIAYKFNSKIKWYTIFDLGIIFDKIYVNKVEENSEGSIIDPNKTPNNTSNDKIHEYILNTNYVNTYSRDIPVELQIFGALKKRVILPYSTDIFKNIHCLKLYPLICPMPKLTINTRLNNNGSEFVMFNNVSKIILPEYTNFDTILDNGIIINIKPLRITNDNGESLKLEIIADENHENSDLYDLYYDDINNDLNISFNIYSFKFVNNYSRKYYNNKDGIAIQDYNKILINTNINKTIIDVDGIFNIKNSGTFTTNFQEIYNRGILGENNHFKLIIVGMIEDFFEDSGLSEKNITIRITNNSNDIIKLYVRNITTTNSNDLINIDNSSPASRTITLSKTPLFSNKINIDEGIFELYPKLLDINEDNLQYNGETGNVAISVTSPDDLLDELFKNIIMDDIIIKITGIETNNTRFLVNISEDNDLKFSNTNFSFSTMNDSFFNKITFRPIPNITINNSINVELLYTVKTNESNHFVFTKLNHFDNSINDSSLNNIIVDRFSAENYKELSEDVVVKAFGVETNGDVINFNVTEENTYYFDMSHESNIGSRLRFFTDKDCNNEIINDITKLPISEISKNIDPGYPGAFVKIKMPLHDTVNGTFYYKNKFRKNKDLILEPGIITVDKKKFANAKQALVSDIIQNSNGVLTYNPPNYDIFSTKYELLANNWKDISFNTSDAFVSRIQDKITFDFDYSDNPGTFFIENTGQWYDKQVFMDTDISFNRKNDEITKIRFKHKLDNSILNITFVDCSSTATHNIFNNNKLNLNSNHFIKDNNFIDNDISYNYYAIINNNINNNQSITFLFEKYNNDYSGNIYLLGTEIDNLLNFCQVKLYNQPDFDERTNHELLYKINFDNIKDSGKIDISGLADISDKTLTNYIRIYENNTDICNSIVCSEIIINKDNNDDEIFSNIIESPTLNLLFKNDSVHYGIGYANKLNNSYNNDKIEYSFLSNTIDSHALFIVIDEDGKLYFGDDNDNYILLTDDNIKISENFKMIFSLQDISNNNSEENISYDLKLDDKTHIEIDNIYIKNINGLIGTPTEINNNGYDVSSVSVLKTGLSEFSTYIDDNDNGLFNSNDGSYIGKSLTPLGKTKTIEKHYNQSIANYGNTYHNTIDIDGGNGGKYGFWFLIDLSSSEFVDEICITGTSDLNANPQSFYIYGSNDNDAPNQDDCWYLLNRFSYIPGIQNYKINKNEYNSTNEYKIYRNLYIYKEPETDINKAHGKIPIKFRYYRLHINSNFGSNLLKIKKIEFFKKTVVMKNYAFANMKYYTPYFTDKRKSNSSQELFMNTENYLISEHITEYDKEKENTLNNLDILSFAHFNNTTGEYEGLSSYQNTITNNAYYQDILDNNYHLTNNNYSEIYLKTYEKFTLNGQAGLYFTFEVKNDSDILQTIEFQGLKNTVIESGIIINEIKANIKTIYIYGKESIKINNYEKYSDFNWILIDTLNYDYNEYILSGDGYVKKWIKNNFNYDKNFRFYRIVINENFGADYIYIKGIKLGISESVLDKRKRKLEINNLSYNIIKRNTNSYDREYGFFDINFNVREIGYNSLKNKEIFNKYSAYNDISLNSIIGYISNINACSNIRSFIIQTKTVLLTWDFDSYDIYLDIYFEIYRIQTSMEANISGKKIYIGKTRDKYFYDYDPIPFLIADYYIAPVISWGDETIKLEETVHRKFICRDNKFPYGRYNVRADNPKLFTYTNGEIENNIKTGSNCIKNNMTRNPKSSILFKNTHVMTKKEIYKLLSKNMRRPFR